MKRMSVCVLLMALLCAAPFASAQTQQEQILFFYSDECPTCKPMHAYFEELMEFNPELPLSMMERSEHPDEWQAACEGAGIPVWGVPRIFIGEKNFADWSEEEGELVYIPSYYGYMGYKNQILAAIEETAGTLQLPENDGGM